MLYIQVVVHSYNVHSICCTLYVVQTRCCTSLVVQSGCCTNEVAPRRQDSVTKTCVSIKISFKLMIEPRDVFYWNSSPKMSSYEVLPPPETIMSMLSSNWKFWCPNPVSYIWKGRVFYIGDRIRAPKLFLNLTILRHGFLILLKVLVPESCLLYKKNNNLLYRRQDSGTKTFF